MASTRGEEKKSSRRRGAGRRTSSQQKRVEVPQREVERLVRELEHAVLARHPIHQVLAHRRAVVVRTRQEQRGKNKVRSVLCFRCFRRRSKACSARFLRAAAVQTREEAMEGVGARARAMATSAAIAIVRVGSRCGNVRREVVPASDRVERGVVAVAVAPSARVALGKDALSRLFAHLNKCPFST